MGLYVTHVEAREEEKRKNHVLESVVFSWFVHMGLYVTHVEAREEVKTKKTRFRKCGFFAVCPYGPLCHPCGGKGGGKNEKNTRKCGFFVVCPYGPLCHPCGGQGRSIYTGQSLDSLTPSRPLHQKSFYARNPPTPGAFVHAGSVHFEVQHWYMCIVNYCDIISIVCRFLCLYLHFLLPMQMF